MTHISTMTNDSPQERVTVSTWTGWLFTNLVTVWVWNIPTCVNPSCIRGTRDIFPMSSLPVTILREYGRSMEVRRVVVYVPIIGYHFLICVLVILSLSTRKSLNSSGSTIPHEKRKLLFNFHNMKYQLSTIC